MYSFGKCIHTCNRRPWVFNKGPHMCTACTGGVEMDQNAPWQPGDELDLSR